MKDVYDPFRKFSESKLNKLGMRGACTIGDFSLVTGLRFHCLFVFGKAVLAWSFPRVVRYDKWVGTTWV